MYPTDLHERLGAALEPDPAHRPAPGDRLAGVLVPVVGGGSLVLTKRSDALSRHAGEISFPGGRMDDDEDLLDTALREAEEEIGLARELVQVVGALPPTGTIVTNYAVYPFVGLTRSGNVFRPNPVEVDQVVELALPDLIDGFERKRLIRRGVPIKTDTYTVGGHLIWGVTARILGTLLERLRPLL
jgi:8-oxo-dGTP pyrophosphatase MutT (NUDIX family)